MTVAQLNAYGKAVADLLPGWTVQPTEVEFSISFKDNEGREFNINTHTQRGRFTVSGCYPLHFYPEDAPSIGTSLQKSPKDMANDVQKRFLPRYIPVLDREVARKRQYDDNANKQNVALQQLCDTLDYKPSTFEGRDRVRPFIHGITELRVGHDGSTATFELTSLPFDVAKELILLLKKSVRKD